MSYLAKANKLFKAGDIVKAKLIIEEAIKFHSHYYLYHAKLGELYLTEKDIEQARVCFENAAKLNPTAVWVEARLVALNEMRQSKSSPKRFCGIYDVYPDLTGKRKIEGGLRTRGFFKSSKPNQPLVTIITAVYNNTETFKRCIDSVRAQVYPNVEYIVIDGGSSIETLQIIQDNADFIDYFISEPDCGIYSAMNKGIELAQGEYICLLNSDDIYHPEFLSKTIRVADQYNHEFDIIYTDYFAGASLLRAQEINNGILFGHLHICHNTFLTAKGCYDRIGRYSEHFKIVSDAAWMRRAFLNGAKFKCVNEALFTLSEGGLSSGNTEERRKLFINEMVESYRQIFPFLSPSDAEEIYLFRFNKNRASALRFIAEKYKTKSDFITALGKYVEHCLKDRSNFILSHTESDGAFLELCKLIETLNGDLKCIQINTKHGLFSDVLKRIDSILALRKKNPRKTILHFVTVFSAPSETFIYDLLTRLESETVYDNFILFEHEKLREERPYVKAIHVPWGDFRPEVAAQIYKYIIDKLRVDVVIAHFALNEWKLATRIKSLNLLIPTISMTHGIDAFTLRDKADYRKYILEEFCTRSDTLFTAVSQYLKNELLSHGIPDEKIVLLHNSVDERIFKHRKSNGFYDSSRPLKLLSVGRLIQWKGHDFLIRAVKIFKDTCTQQVHLTIVYGNSGDFLGAIEKLIKELGLSQNVSLIPFVNFKEQPDYFAKFDCFIHPSTYSANQYQRSETFGVAVLEAIAAGLPVISTDAGGLPEVIGEEHTFAKVVPHASSEAIAEALAEFWKTRNAFADNRHYAEERLQRFSARDQVTTLSKLISQVANTSVKAALFSSSTMQGAGYAAYRLHKGLRMLSDHSMMPDLFTTVRNHEKESDIHVIKHPSGDSKHWRFLQPNPKPGHTIFTINQPNIPSRDLIAMVDKHDIINLHWHARFLSIENIATLTQLGKPVVMTIRDMFPITGGCHFFHGCSRWQENCSECPQIPSKYKDYPSKILAVKRNYYDFANLTIVTLSTHSRQIVESSPYFNTCRIEVIPNSIETDVFRPYNKLDARRELGLPLNRQIIGYVPSYSSSVKGYKEIIEAFDILKNNCLSINPFVMLVGNETPATSLINLDKKYLGYISDNAKLALAYSAADVVVVPSLEETFSNTTAEAISCGVPVVGFKTGAIPDLVLNGKTGYIYDIGDAKGLAEGIQSVLNGPNLAENCRKHALSYLSFMNQARRYEALFHELVAFQVDRRTNEEAPKIFECFEELGSDIFGISLEMYGK